MDPPALRYNPRQSRVDSKLSKASERKLSPERGKTENAPVEKHIKALVKNKKIEGEKKNKAKKGKKRKRSASAVRRPSCAGNERGAWKGRLNRSG